MKASIKILFACTLGLFSCKKASETPTPLLENIAISVVEHPETGTEIGQIHYDGFDNLTFSKDGFSYNHKRHGGALKLDSFDPVEVDSITGKIYILDNWYFDFETFEKIHVDVDVYENEEYLEEITVTLNLQDTDDSTIEFSQVTHTGLDFNEIEWHEAVVFNEKLWVMGGWVDGAARSNSIYSSTDGKNWTKVSVIGDQFSPRVSFQTLVFQDKLWVFGGGTEGDVWSSPNGINWTEEVASDTGFPEKRAHQVVIFKSKLWLVAGTGDGGASNAIWSSEDGVNWQQETIPSDIFSERYFHEAIVFNNKLWVFGGVALDWDSKSVWSTSDGLNWAKETIIGRHFSPYQVPQATVFNGQLWVIGGGKDYNTASITKNDDFALDFEAWSTPDGVNWIRETTTGKDLSKLNGHKLIRFQNKMWVIGGGSNEIWVSE